MGQLGADNHPTGTRATANIRPPETGRNTQGGCHFDERTPRRGPTRSRSQSWQLRMEPLWSPVVATGGKRWQMPRAQTGRKPAKSLAVGCDGKEGVDGSSP